MHDAVHLTHSLFLTCRTKTLYTDTGRIPDNRYRAVEMHAVTSTFLMGVGSVEAGYH